MTDVTREHALLLRHWASVQTRVSHQVCEQARRCNVLEAELLRLRARWVVATTQMLWGLGWPGLPPPSTRASPADATEPPPTTAAEVICQTGCIAHAHHWLGEQGQCQLTGVDCVREAGLRPVRIPFEVSESTNAS